MNAAVVSMTVSMHVAIPLVATDVDVSKASGLIRQMATHVLVSLLKKR